MTKTAEELTVLTLDFLSEHTNEAAAAVALGIVWHLVWERPKYLSSNAAAADNGTLYPNNNDDLAEPVSGNRIRQTTQLRGNLRKELQLVLNENEELERLVRELRSHIEGTDPFFQTQDFLRDSTPTQVVLPIGMPSSSTRKRFRNKNNNDAGLISTTIGVATNEFDALASCWALLVFGFCLVSTRRRRKRDNPLSTTIVLLEKAQGVTNDYFQAEVLPALTKIWIYLAHEYQELYARTIDADSNSGRAIATVAKTVRSRSEAIVGSIETVVYDRILPVSVRLTKRGVEYTHLVVNAIAALEMPKWKEQPPTVLLSEHDEAVQTLESSRNQEESRRKALEEKVAGYEQALKGKEVLLHAERMKTRSAKLEATTVRLEREETRRKESRDTEASARMAVAEDQRRILRGFLSEHILSRQQQDRLRKIEEKNSPKKSTIVLPDPILQGFASAMYVQNLSDLSTIHSTTPSEQQRQHRAVFGIGDFPTDCRDDACDNDDDDYYGNPNETRLREIKEQFLRSKTVANSLRPSRNTDCSHPHVDAGNTNQASTGSLLWNAANHATKSTTTKKQKQQQQHLSTRAAAATTEQEPSSWMEDPASIMCDWRMNGNEEEMRE